MSAAKNTRLTREIWLETGLAALAKDGPSALRAEALARRLGTTKGSFYWHFTDLPAYHAALIALWEEGASARLDAALAEARTDPSKLRRLAQAIAGERASRAAPTEQAMRVWAMADSAAAGAVARIDATRLELMRDLLDRIGVGNPEMSRIIYAASLGMAALGDGDADENAGAIGSLVDLVLALR